MALGFTLNQTLHGYADGHQLLATSIDLSADRQALLLVMSDLSGPAFRTGFETYLTGYPLQNSGYYCFARTWFAPELPRPGCVWTHTLLIKNEDLARLNSLRGLDKLFKRPGEHLDAHSYEGRIHSPNESWQSITDLGDTRPVLEGLYGTARKVVVPSETSVNKEPLLFAIFDQQWPRLRRGFRFCTGALSLREGQFDLSISPPEQTHSIGSQGLIVSDRRDKARASGDWLDIAFRDLGQSEQSEYRRFLWQFGSDYADGRTAFRPLTEVYSLLDSADDKEPLGDKVLSAISHFYPKPTESRRLKAELFSSGGRYLKDLGGDEIVTQLLVTHPSANALDEETAAVHDRSIAFAKSDIDGAIALATLAAQLGGENARQYLEGFFEEGSRSEAVIGRAPASLVLDVLDRQPTLVANPVLWKRLDHMGLVNRALARLAADDTLLDSAITAMMAAEAWDALATVVTHLGDTALRPLFKIVDGGTHHSIDYPDRLFEVAWSNPNVVVRMIEKASLGPVSLKLLSAEIDPRSWHLRQLGVRPWLRAAHSDHCFASAQRTINSAVFLLSVGLSSREEEGAMLVTHSFAVVYDAAATDKLGGPQWQRLEPALAWYSPTWDKCARLIRTVARAFRDKDWPIHLFALTFQSDEQFANALDELDESWKGSRYIKRLKEVGLQGGVSWSSSQSKALAKFN